MGAFGFLLAWYNLPFVIALGCCVVLALIQVLGGLGDHDADADADVDGHVDVDADVDADIDAPVDLHTGLDGAEHPDLQISPDGGAHADFHPAHTHDGPLAGALSALGVGRVPLMLVLMLFLGSFGAVGLLVNTLLANALGSYPALAFFAVLVAGLLLGLWLTSRSSRLFARLAPNSSTAVSFDQLVGRAGVVVSTNVSPTYGRVQVKDGFGSLHTVYAVIDRGQPVPERSEVALVAYDAARRCFIVREFNQVRSRRQDERVNG